MEADPENTETPSPAPPDQRLAPPPAMPAVGYGPAQPSSWNQWTPPYGPYGSWPPNAYPAMPPAYGSSTLAVIAGSVLLVAGLIVGVIAVLTLVFALSGADAIEMMDPTMVGMGDAIATVGIILSIIFLVVAALDVAAAVGIFTHRAWARWLGIVLATLGVVLGGLALLGLSSDPLTVPSDTIVVLLWTIAHAYVLAGLAAGGRHFQAAWAPRY